MRTCGMLRLTRLSTVSGKRRFVFQERRFISGGCLMLGKARVKTWARLQQSVAFSSAESELYALVEGSREALGARCAVGHILGHEGEID